ncbi:hypothetical protein NM688_g9230 [Phlebia brevispora]|uniref:Uncharacterized protein n=1 Tax=Phlebia brevispora TaxID=194682 RepID=A0ACC1RLG3_9APHY|nr:hypothetical protein NM688_g9230 [Phlebia brevispora]
MDLLPLELHSQIFELACVDDGSTARSLSIVSRYVRDVAEPFFYQSLTVAGLGPLTEFLARLQRLPSHRRHVRRLFLSDRTAREMLQKSVPMDDANMDQYQLEKSVIIHILDLVAPALQSLTFLISCPFTSTELIGHLFSLKLPRLRALAVHGYYPFPHLPDAMPNVEHLHLSGNRNPHGLLQIGGLDVACPRMTHLHVSGLVSASSFAEELEEALSPDCCGRTASRFAAVLPPHLRRLTVQAGPAPPKAKRRSSACKLHEKMSERFVILTRRKDMVPEVEFNARVGCIDSVYESMHRDWADDSV